MQTDGEEILGMKYRVEGATIISEKVAGTEETELRITQEGISTIKAYTYTESGERSVEVVEEVKIDNQTPEKPTIVANGTRGDDRKLV